jgi:hypothetical protein
MVRAAFALAFAIACLSASATAHSEVVMDPPAVRLCAFGKTWDDMSTCLGKLHIKANVLETTKDARLAKLVQSLENRPMPTYEIGIYLYVNNGKMWQLAGALSTSGTTSEILGFSTVPVGSHTAYRVDVGETMQMSQNFGTTTVTGDVRMHHTMFCPGDNWRRCINVLASCEMLVRGRALFAFHGAVSIAKNMVIVDGDISKAGMMCAGKTSAQLVWGG